MSQSWMMLLFGSIISGIVGIGFKAITSMVARSIKQMDDSVTKLNVTVEKIKSDINLTVDGLKVDNKRLSDSFHEFELEAAKSYASQRNMEKNEMSNLASHGNLHARVDGLSDRVTRIETVQAHCNHCNSKAN